MKKLITLFISLCLLSCSIEGDEQPNFSVELMSIDSVVMPDQFVFGETHQVTVNYTRPSGCYIFNRFISDPSGNTRTIAVMDTVYTDTNCTQEPQDATVSFDFTVTDTNTYTFQFYQGKDENEQDRYLIIEVPVIQ